MSSSIPIKCFTCGMVIADKYPYYLAAVRQKKMNIHKNALKDGQTGSHNLQQMVYLTPEFYQKTPEGEVMDEMGLTKSCCRRHLMTHVDI